MFCMGESAEFMLQFGWYYDQHTFIYGFATVISSSVPIKQGIK